MTVSADYGPQIDSGNGVTQNFPVTFPFDEKTDLVVTLFDTVANADVTPAPVFNGAAGYDYTVSGNPDPDTGIYPSGSVTFNTAPPAGWKIIRARNTPRHQPVSLIDNGRFPAKTVEGEFDRLQLQIQEMGGAGGALSRAIVAPDSDDPPPDLVLAPSSVRADTILMFDAAGNVARPGISSGAIEAAIAAIIAGINPMPAVTAWAKTLAAALVLFAAPVVVADGQAMDVSCRMAIGDGYGGRFAYDAGDVTSTFLQNGTGFVDAAGRRWKRSYDRGLSVKWFGAKGDGIADDTAALNACSDAAYDAGVAFHSVVLPVGVYLISGKIGFKASFVGEEQNNCFIRAKNTFAGSDYLVDMAAAPTGSNRVMINIFFDLRQLGTATMVTSLGSSTAGGGGGSFSTTWLNCRWIGLSLAKAILTNSSTANEPNFILFGTFIGCAFSSPRCVSLGSGANVVKFICGLFDNGNGGASVPIENGGGVNVCFDTCGFEFRNCGGNWFHVGPGTMVIDNCFAESIGAPITDASMFQIDVTGASSNPEARLHIRQLSLNVAFGGAGGDNGLVLIIAATGAFRSCYVSIDGLYRSSGGGTPWNNLFLLHAVSNAATGPIRLSIKDCDEMFDLSMARSGSVPTTANVVWQLQGWHRGVILNHTAPHPVAGNRLTWTYQPPAPSFTG